MSGIAQFTLFPVVFMVALPGWAAFPPGGTLAETRQDQLGGISELGAYRSELLRRAAWNVHPGPAGTTQLQAQERQTPSSAPDRARSSDEEQLDLSDQVTQDVFEPLQRGIEAHNFYQVLAIFDRQEMTDYAQFRDHLRAFFNQYDAIRFRYQLLQVTSDKNHGSAVAEVEMEATPADPSASSLRRDTQLRLQLRLGPKGWRLMGFAPADFFTQ